MVLRARQKTWLAKRLRFFFLKIGLLVLVVGGGVWGLTSPRSSFSTWLRANQPVWSVHAPDWLAHLPVEKELPKNPYWVWLPGRAVHLRGYLLARFPALADIRFDRNFFKRRVDIYLEPKMPLARWNDKGIDAEGHVFPLDARYQLPLPEIHLVEAAAAKEVGPWLSAMAQTPWFWQKITGIRQDPYGGLRLTTQSGTEVLWGEPSVPKIAKKIYYLNQVLNDAAERVGGVERADLRFFEEGRISVRPKKPGSI